MINKVKNLRYYYCSTDQILDPYISPLLATQFGTEKSHIFSFWQNFNSSKILTFDLDFALPLPLLDSTLPGMKINNTNTKKINFIRSIFLEKVIIFLPAVLLEIDEVCRERHVVVGPLLGSFIISNFNLFQFRVWV